MSLNVVSSLAGADQCNELAFHDVSSYEGRKTFVEV